MVEPSINSNHSTIPVEESFQKHWFCVWLDTEGGAHKMEGDNPSGFAEALKSSQIIWVDFLSDDPLGGGLMEAEKLGFTGELISSIKNDSRLNYQDFDSEMYLQLPCIQIRGENLTVHPILFLVRKNLVLTIHTTLVDKRFIRLRRYSDKILRKIPLDLTQEDKLTTLIIRIIDANNNSNFRHLRIIEELGDNLNEDLMSPLTDRSKLGPKIYQMKHTLISYMNALWESVDLLHTLRYGDAELLTDDDRLLEIISGMIDQVKSQIALAEHMSEVVASGLEVMQTIYNNQLQQLNNRFALVMTYLTIIGTAVLVPNTLATALGNSVFEIGPRDLWWYVLLMVGATIICTFLVWWWFKRKGWLPSNKDWR